MTFCRVALVGSVWLLVTRTLADADLWGHVRFGLDMLASKSIPSHDIYSFTADRPWINHEWLAEVLMGAAYMGGGATGLIALKLFVIFVIAGILMAVAIQERASPLARDLFVGLTVVVTYTRTQAVRPQMFSIALFCVLLYLLREHNRGRAGTLWAVPLCFVAWVNLHGGWIVGLAVLGVWMVGDAWRHRSGRRTLTLAGIGALSLLATLVNPYGYGLWQFLFETVGTGRPDITDWKPLLQLPPAILVIESILPLVALAALWSARTRWSVPGRDVAVLLLLVAATLRVGRVDAFLQCAIAVLLAPQLIALLNAIERNARNSFHRATVPVGVMAIALAAYTVAVGTANLRVIGVGGQWVPDRDAALFLRESRPGARVLTWFDWGEYALWQLSPAGIRVSMDGRRETVYSEEILRDHWRFYSGAAETVDYPDRIGADHVWLPSNLPIVEPLMRDGWRKVLDTGKSVVLARDGNPVQYRPAVPDGRDVFPWP